MTATATAPARPAATRGDRLARLLLIAVAVCFLGLFLIAPLLVVFTEALRQGARVYLRAVSDRETRAAVVLSLQVAAWAVAVNLIFGVAAAWAIARFRFRGRQVLSALIDLPLGVSPVVAGLIFVLLCGRRGLLGPWLAEHGVQVIFATPGIVLCTAFVTFPMVARELIPFMEAQGTDEEEAAIMLGASGWQTFVRVTLPNIRWGLVYGVILCSARALGEFGAVSVVSGHIRGATNTVPLHVEALYNEYQFAAAFAVASLLGVLAVVTLGLKRTIEWQARRMQARRLGSTAL